MDYTIPPCVFVDKCAVVHGVVLWRPLTTFRAFTTCLDAGVAADTDLPSPAVVVSEPADPPDLVRLAPCYWSLLCAPAWPAWMSPLGQRPFVGRTARPLTCMACLARAHVVTSVLAP